jgi:hypothetical protein
MAAITRFETGSVIFNVDDSVGKFGRNRTTDVQLVQVLLNKLIQNIHDTGEEESPLPVPDLLATDGICGAKTIAAILWCQKSLNYGLEDKFKLVAEDATINHADDGTYGPPKAMLFYTIWNINYLLEDRNILPQTAGEITVQPLRSELEKYFNMGLVPNIP